MYERILFVIIYLFFLTCVMNASVALHTQLFWHRTLILIKQHKLEIAAYFKKCFYSFNEPTHNSYEYTFKWSSNISSFQRIDRGYLIRIRSYILFCDK